MPASVFPPSGTVSPAGLPDYSVYVDPGGSDSSQGSQGAPFRTLYAATLDVISRGGGTVNFNDSTITGGLLSDQGVYLRNDGIAVPGFIDMNNAPICFRGIGNSSGQFAFERPGAARFIGGSTTDPTKPALWVVGSEVPVYFGYMKNFVPESNGVMAPVRIGWDYVRKADFSLEALSITNATRSGGSTVHTIDIAGATSWAITHADRDADDNVTLTLTRPLTIAMSPWTPGTYIRVNTGGDTDFPNVDALVTAQSDVLNLQGETTITVTYVQSGATTAKSLSGSVKSHGCQAGDLVYLQSVDSEFVSCSQMTVTAATVTTVTVSDPYGYAPRSASANQNNIGTITKHLRGRQVASGISFDACSFFGKADSADNFLACPTWDCGGTSVNDTRFTNCYGSGGNRGWDWTSNPERIDTSRTQVVMLSDPGAGTISGASFQAYDCQSQSGHLIWNPHGTEAKIYVSQWLQDSGGGALPTVVCGNGSTFASVFLDRIRNDDADQSAITIGTGYDRSKVIIGQVLSSNPSPVVNLSDIIGPVNLRSAIWSDDDTKSPWELGWGTTWPGGSTIPYVGGNRAMGPVQARYTNLFPDSSNWVGGSGMPPTFPTGVTVTVDGDAPDGSATAIKVVCDNTYDGSAIIFGKYPFTGTGWNVGDRNIFGCWLKTSADGVQFIANSYTPGDIVWAGSGSIRLSRMIRENSWQWLTAAFAISALGGKQYFFELLPPAGVGTYYLFAPSFLYVPASVPGSDFYEYARTYKHQPFYLPAGMSGTMENTIFCAHKGIASVEETVTLGAANGSSIKAYDTAGNFIGYIELKDEA